MDHLAHAPAKRHLRTKTPSASPELRTLDAHALGPVLRKSALSIMADLSRAPHRLPPPIRIGGARGALWLESTVLEWLQSHEQGALEQPRRRGRPTKAEQLARRLAEQQQSDAA